MGQSKQSDHSFRRFRPSDEDLITLLCKGLRGNRDVIRQDIYRSSPWDLKGGVEGVIDSKKLYCFTRRRVDRTTGCGVWQDTGPPKPIKHKDGVEGIKQQFIFLDYPESPKSMWGKWFMDEITTTRANGKFEEFAICKIRIDFPKKNKIEVLRKWKSFFHSKGLLKEEKKEEAEAAAKVHDSINMQAEAAEEEAEVEAAAAEEEVENFLVQEERAELGMRQNDRSGTPNEEGSYDLISDDMYIEGCGGETEKPVCEPISVECPFRHLEIDESCVAMSEMPLGRPHLQGDMTDHRSEKEEMQM